MAVSEKIHILHEAGLPCCSRLEEAMAARGGSCLPCMPALSHLRAGHPLGRPLGIPMSPSLPAQSR